MGFALREAISFCEAGGRLLFLDRRRDRYFCLSEDAERSFRRLASRHRLEHLDEEALARLVAGGVLNSASDSDIPVPCRAPPNPVRSLFEEDLRPRALHVGQALVRLTASSLELKLWPFHASLLRVERRKVKLSQATMRSPEAAQDIAAAFKRTGLLVPSLDRCLPRSIALAHSLLDVGVAPSVVIGVRLNPFGAHCWIQVEDLLLNESLDQVRNFTPILVV